MSDKVVLDGDLSLNAYLDGDMSLNARLDGEQGQYTRYNWRGYSAYEIAVQHGFIGTEEEWLESLQGEQGIQGIQGPKGDKGDTGESGYSPVRGTDYWTTADLDAIIEDVLDALPVAEEVSF